MIRKSLASQDGCVLHISESKVTFPYMVESKDHDKTYKMTQFYNIFYNKNHPVTTWFLLKYLHLVLLHAKKYNTQEAKLTFIAWWSGSI